MQINKTFIYGKHPVKEAFEANPDVIKVIYFERGEKDTELKSLADKHSLVQEEFNGQTIPREIPKDAVHQGVLAEIDPTKLIIEYEEFMSTLEISNDSAFVILGEVNDPQNVGAIIRSAAAFGISAVLIPEHRQVQVNGTVIKASAGMAFKIPLISIGNVNQAIKDLKDKGCWVYGLDGEAETKISEEGFEKPSVFILGNEGKGIREKTLDHCDILLKIPIRKDVESLNASVAAGVTFYAWKNRK